MTADPVAAYVAGREFRMLIDGEFADAGQAAVREVIDPSTGRVVGEVPEASPADVTAAVAAAGAAQPGWQALGVDGRAECFRRFG
ncbi:MAG: aldehyde dehydrogenase family protein, partial [Streptosporangiaceae bacterium]